MAPVTATPNDLWTADFKGQFTTRDGIWCHPLTIADQHTRFLLTCRGLLSTKGVGVKPFFEHAFREDELPLAIRPDNGVPFATTCASTPDFPQLMDRQIPAATGD